MVYDKSQFEDFFWIISFYLMEKVIDRSFMVKYDLSLLFNNISVKKVLDILLEVFEVGDEEEQKRRIGCI